MIIDIPVYHKVDLLDVTAPHEVFQWIGQYGPKCEVEIIAEQAGEIATRDDFRFIAPKGFADVAALDVLWVPGEIRARSSC
jgi:putative intracellular protease/amidase